MAIAYFRALLDERPGAVCGVVTEPPTTSMRCTVRPRIPRERYASVDGRRVRVTHIDLDDVEGHAWISGVLPGPIQSVSLRRVGKAWRVTGNRAFGLA